MKTLIVIETVDELFKVARRTRMAGDESPTLPDGAVLVFENNMETIRLEKAPGFVLSDEISFEEIFRMAFNKMDLNIHIT